MEKSAALAKGASALYIFCWAGLIVDGVVALAMANEARGACTGVFRLVILTTVMSGFEFFLVWWAGLLWWPWDLATGDHGGFDAYFAAKLQKMPELTARCYKLFLVVALAADVTLVIHSADVVVGAPACGSDTLFATQAQIRLWPNIAICGLLFLAVAFAFLWVLWFLLSTACADAPAPSTQAEV